MNCEEVSEYLSLSGKKIDARDQIMVRAAELGFADCRIVQVSGPAAHAAEFQAWIDAGWHGDMGWMAKNPQRRMDPREVLPGVRSVVVVAMNYFQPDIEEVPDGGGDAGEPFIRGVISRYAWGADYHDMMEERLDALAAFLRELGGTQRRYVDTGPMLERDWATAAGLGWNGKSTVQIHPKLGAWFFLGEILTTLELPPDAPLTLTCGTCTRCITACPTGAIDRPHHVEATKCVSYLTIENKGPIPMEFRKAMGARIYGCDDCVAACPWNRFAKASAELHFAARPYVHGWALRDFLALDDAAFRELFRGSPIKRLKRPRFLRNVCVALGNVGTAADVPALQIAAMDADPLIAEHAIWALAEIGQRLVISPNATVASPD